MNSVNTYPPPEPRATMTSTPRAPTDPVPFGFMSVMRGRNVDDFDELQATVNQQEKKLTQEEQDVEDDKARKRAMKNLVNSWQERLQLISVITTFFATTEAAMLVNTRPANHDDLQNNVLKVANASLLGSLILHVYASVLSFLGAFLLISYKLREARREEMIVEGIAVVNSPLEELVIKDVERDAGLPRTLTSNGGPLTRRNSVHSGTTASVSERNKANNLGKAEPPIFSADPHIEQVIPFIPSTTSHRLLSRTHTICVVLTAKGFVLAIIGIVCYSWAVQPNSVSIFTSACLGLALLTTIALRI